MSLEPWHPQASKEGRLVETPFNIYPSQYAHYQSYSNNISQIRVPKG